MNLNFSILSCQQTIQNLPYFALLQDEILDWKVGGIRGVTSGNNTVYASLEKAAMVFQSLNLCIEQWQWHTCLAWLFFQILEEIELGISKCTKGGAKFIFGNAFWHCA